MTTCRLGVCRHPPVSSLFLAVDRFSGFKIMRYFCHQLHDGNRAQGGSVRCSAAHLFTGSPPHGVERRKCHG